MDELEQTMTRYLLGELSESEQTALEEKYFTDPQVFDQVLRTESELLDSYARNQLSAEARLRFEQSYLINPRRRERVKFAEALATRLNQTEAFERAEAPVLTMSRWQRLLAALGGQRRALEFSIALASLLIMIGGIWFFIESRRLQHELAQTRATQADQERREQELAQQVASERERAEKLAAELERLQRTQTELPQATPTPTVRAAAPTFVTLLLTAGGVRGSGTAGTQTLVIPPGTAQARLQLNLKQNDYPRYSISLQAVGGGEIFSRQNLKPRATRSGASFTLTVPAQKLADGEYILTLRGISPEGEVDDLSKSIFRVENR